VRPEEICCLITYVITVGEPGRKVPQNLHRVIERISVQDDDGARCKTTHSAS
jgi:hypothetical protein